MPQGTIRIRGAPQHNLKNLDVGIRTGRLTAPSGKCRQDFPTIRLAAQSCGEPRNRKYGYQYDQVRDKSGKDRICQIHRIAWHSRWQHDRDKDHTQD